jgi:protein-S-isoprenylcysteine O-methyltransferase Ste14
MPERPYGRSLGPDIGWVALQLFILASAIFGGMATFLVIGRQFTLGAPIVNMIAGATGLLLCVYILFRAVRDLAGNLTASPTPVDGGELVTHGIYATVRHPMYSALLSGVIGFALLVGSWVALAAVLVLVPFFIAKARHEERLLSSRYPGYEAYASRVRWRFIPGLA